MGSWYWIGVCAGLGVAVGVLLAGVLTRTRAALIAALVLAAAAGVALGFAWIPVAGYLEATLVPALAARLRGRAGERYAGLRSLAKD
jgi:hypothetical protein